MGGGSYWFGHTMRSIDSGESVSSEEEKEEGDDEEKEEGAGEESIGSLQKYFNSSEQI